MWSGPAASRARAVGPARGGGRERWPPPPTPASSNAGLFSPCAFSAVSPDLSPDALSAGLLWVSPDFLPSMCSSLPNGNPRRLRAGRRVAPPPPACHSGAARAGFGARPQHRLVLRSVPRPPGLLQAQRRNVSGGHPTPPGSDPATWCPEPVLRGWGPGGGAGQKGPLSPTLPGLRRLDELERGNHWRFRGAQ